MKLNRGILLRYVLGECSAQESRKIESAYFANPELLNRLNLVTDELVAAYVAGKMSASLRNRFERCLESKPFIRQKVEKAQSQSE